MLRCAYVFHVLLKEEDAYLYYKECMNVTLACGMIFSRGSMLRLSKSGAVCSRQSAFARMRMAFFCCLNIAVVLASGACIYVGAI